MVGTVRGPGAHSAHSANRLQPTARFQESPKVAAVVAELAKRAQQGGASSIMFLPQRGVTFDAYAFAYSTGLAKEMNIPKPPAGPLRGTVIINVSGHATGGLTDRVTAWAEKTIAGESIKVGSDAGKLILLRQACDTAVRALQTDLHKTRQSVTIDVGNGRSLKLSRALFDKMQKASGASAEPELRQLAHDGDKALRKLFAAENTYNVRVRLPDGSVQEQRQVPRNDPSTLEYVTRIPLEIPEGVRGEVILEAWPTGSAEVAGHVEARRYRIHVGDELFDVQKAIEAAKRYQAAHPEIRWDTHHESDDLEVHRVAPSPYPYQDF